MGPSICPVCNGKTMMCSAFYGGALGGAMTTCKSCAGTGVIWPPGTDEFLTALTQAAAHTRDPLGLYVCADVDGTDAEWRLTADASSHSDWMTELQGAVRLNVEQHPERKAVLDYLNTLPDDMPIMVLTPQSYAEINAAEMFVDSCRAYVKQGNDNSVWLSASKSKLARMVQHNGPRLALPPEVSPRLAGLPVSEGDE